MELETKGSGLKKERMPKSKVHQAIREKEGTVVLETDGTINNWMHQKLWIEK